MGVHPIFGVEPRRRRRGAGDQTVLDGEQAGPSPVRDANLRVDVFDVVGRRLLRDAQSYGDLLDGQAARGEAEHLHFSRGQTGRPRPATANRMPGRAAARPRPHRRRAGPRLPPAQMRRGIGRRQLGAVGPRLEFGPVRVGRCRGSGPRRQRVAGKCPAGSPSRRAVHGAPPRLSPVERARTARACARSGTGAIARVPVRRR